MTRKLQRKKNMKRHGWIHNLNNGMLCFLAAVLYSARPGIVIYKTKLIFIVMFPSVIPQQC